MITRTKLFSVGDLVVFKTHPLLNSYEIRGDGKYVPPIMIVKEVFFENKQKKTHDDTTGDQIAEYIKYMCIYFDDNKSEFVEACIYESGIEGITNLKIGRLDDPDNLNKSKENLIDEVLKYPRCPNNIFGKIIYFKTKKLELLKKRASIKITEDPKNSGNFVKKRTIQYIVNYTTPDFICCGSKVENYTDLFYGNGKPKRLVSKYLLKVKWFNPIHQKFSEEYLPIECFTDVNPFPQVSASFAGIESKGEE